MTPEQRETLAGELAALRAAGVDGEGLRTAIEQSDVWQGMTLEERQMTAGRFADRLESVEGAVSEVAMQDAGVEASMLEDIEAVRELTPEQRETLAGELAALRAAGVDGEGLRTAIEQSDVWQGMTLEERQMTAGRFADRLESIERVSVDGEMMLGGADGVSMLEDIEAVRELTPEQRETLAGELAALRAAGGSPAEMMNALEQSESLEKMEPAQREEMIQELQRMLASGAVPGDGETPGPATVEEPDGVPSHDWMAQRLEQLQAGELSEEEAAEVNEALSRYNDHYGIEGIDNEASTTDIIERIQDVGTELDESDVVALRQMMDGEIGDRVVVRPDGSEITIREWVEGIIPGTETALATNSTLGEITNIRADLDAGDVDELQAIADDPDKANLVIQVPATDETGQPIQATDENGVPLVDADDNPIYEMVDTTIGEHINETLLPSVQGQLDWQATNSTLGEITNIRADLDAGDVDELQAIADDPDKANLVIQVPATDESGQPIQATDENGEPVVDAEGNPIYEMVDTTIGEHINETLLPSVQGQLDWQATNSTLGEITNIRADLDEGDVADLQAIAADPDKANLVIPGAGDGRIRPADTGDG